MYKSLGSLGPLLRYERRKAVFLVLSSLVLAASEALSIALVLPIINILVSGSPGDALDRVAALWGIPPDPNTLGLMVLALFGLAVTIKTLLAVANTYWLAAYAEGVRKSLAKTYLSNFLQSSIGQHSRSQVLSVALNESSNAAKLSRDIIDLFSSSVIVIGLVVVMTAVTPELAVVVAVFLPLAIISYRVYLRKYSEELGKKRTAINERITSHIRQIAEGFIELRMLGARGFALRYVEQAFAGYGSVIGRITATRIFPAKFAELAISAIFITLAAIRLGGVAEAVPVGELGVFFAALLRIGVKLADGYGLVLSINNKLPALRAIQDMGMPQGNVSDQPVSHSESRASKPNEMIIDVISGQVGGFVIGVRDYAVKRGAVNAVIGRSGKGKTSFCHFLCGLRESQEFSVTVDGRSYTTQGAFLADLRVCYVPQNPAFFDLTVMENLMLSKWKVDQTELWEMLKLVGLETWGRSHAHESLGDKRLTPSVGQLRRLALARAFLTDPDLIVIDEPTAGLDGESERQVISAVEGIANERLVLVVTHSEDLIARSANVLRL